MSQRIAAFLLVVALPMIAQAQPHFQFTSRSSNASPLQANGRETWFCVPQNGPDVSGKEIQLCIASATKAIFHLDYPWGTRTDTIEPYKVTSISLPLKIEMKTSDLIEKKAIRVWSPDADLMVTVMEKSGATGDGFNAIPNIGLGTDYVIASYESLFEGFGTYVYDLPSEFCAFAIADNTQITVTLSSDARGRDSLPSEVRKAGKPFTETLNRGEAVQFKLLQAQDADNYDITGSTVHSDKPVGVIGASQCAEIPSGYPYCGFISEMMPPIRTWGRTYYTQHIYNGPSHSGSTYLVIGTKSNQVISRWDSDSGLRVQSILRLPYDHAWSEVKTFSRWQSADPFLLVQYLNSRDFPDSTYSRSAPAQIVIPSVERYLKRTTFVVPPLRDDSLTCSVNILVNENDEGMTLDGNNLKQYSSSGGDGKYRLWTVPRNPGLHILNCDSVGGCYYYGLGYDKAYGLAAPSGFDTLKSPDTIPPITIVTSGCYDVHIRVKDTGALASKLYLLRADSVYNMAVTEDTTWIEGVGRDSTFLDLRVIDSSKEAYLSLTVSDMAGNSTTLVTTYHSSLTHLTLSYIPFDSVAVGASDTVIDSIVNRGDSTFTPISYRLANGTRGFSLGALSKAPIAGHSSRAVPVIFRPTDSAAALDTLIVSDACQNLMTVLFGNDTTASFTATDITFRSLAENDPTLREGKSYAESQFDNTSAVWVTIDSVTTDDTLFTNYTQYSSSCPPQRATSLVFSFRVTGVGEHVAHAHIYTRQAGKRTITLRATVLPLLGVRHERASVAGLDLLAIQPNPSHGSITVSFSSPASSRVTADVFSILGERVLSQEAEDGARSLRLDLHSLPRGNYILRLSAGGEVSSEMFQVGE